MRRKLFSFGALPLSFVLGVCSQIVWLSLSPNLNQYQADDSYTNISSEIDIAGVYYPAHELPWGLGGVQRIDMIITDSSMSASGSNLEGYLLADNCFYKLSSLNISEGQISFSTVSDLGISYHFKGRMLEGDFPIRGYSQYFMGRTIMFEGLFIKTLWGWKIAEDTVSFTKGSGE